MARPVLYNDDTKVFLRPDGRRKLQHRSARRAIIDRIIEQGGVMTLGELDEAFGYDVRPKVIALIRAGWLTT